MNTNPSKPHRDIIWLIIRLSASLLLLGWLISRTGITSLLNAFGLIPLSAWAFSAGLYTLSQLISSARWQGIASAMGFSGGYVRYLRIYFTGMFFNLFMPTSIGGDLFKAIFLADKGSEGGKVKAGYTVFLDRLAGMTGLFMLGSVTVIIFRDTLSPMLSLILVGITTIWLLLLMSVRWAGNMLANIFPGMSGKIDVMMQIWHKPAVMVRAVALSFLLQFLCTSAFAILGNAMGINVEPAYYFAIFPAVTILSILPVSISGFGIREGSLACFLALRNIPEEQAVALGLALFAVQAIVSLSGGIIYITGAHRR